MSSIQFFHIRQDGIEGEKKMLEEWYKKGCTVPGTRSFHHFSSNAVGSITYKRTSSDDVPTGTQSFFVSARTSSADELSIQTYVACSYDEHWWVGIVECFEEGTSK